MIISHKHKFIFIHIPRTAGTRISKSLCESMGVGNWKKFIGEPEKLIDPVSGTEESDETTRWIGKKHIKAIDLRNELDDKVWDSYFKFAFVRNPWDRSVSTFLHRRKVAPRTVKKIWPRSKMLFNAGLYAKYELLRCDPSQQIDFVSDKNKNIIIDFIGRFENLKVDFKKVCDIIGLDARLGEKYDPTNSMGYQKWYTERGKDIIHREKIDDINKFKYLFS